MKVLARIPALDAVAIPTPAEGGPSAAAPSRPDAAAEGRSRPRRRRSTGRFPTASIAVLGILAAVAWSLASWNDAHRAERSRLERLARMQVGSPSSETISR